MATQSESDGGVPTIAGLVASSDDFNILLKAVQAAGLDGALADPAADLTVFAPTDEAFVKLAKDFGFTGDPSDEDAVFDAIAGALATLGDPIEVLTNVLLYHVSPSAKPLAEVAQLETVDTLLDGATFSPDGTTLVDNEPDLKDPSLVATDVGASNGIVHVIDRVLIPLDIPGNEPQPVTVEAEDMELSGYRVEQDGDASGDALIKLSGKTGTASTTFEGQAGEYDLELFYFDEIDGRAKIEVLINGERVEKIRLDEHLGGFTATAGNATSVVIEGLHLEHGDTIEFVGRKNGLEFARIDKFVLTPVEPKPTIAEIATDNGNFEILLKAVEAAGLTGPLLDPESDLTVFAPTDEAFAALAVDFGFEGDTSDKDAVFDAIVAALTELGGGDPIPLLTDVLLYHLSEGAKLLEEVGSLETVDTLLEGATFAPDGTTLVDNEPDLEDPDVVIPDIEASNGVIHAIDRVLIPLDIPGNEPSIAELVASSDDFDILLKAVQAAGLDGALADPAADLTVFAPTDEAFVKLAKDFGFTGDPSDEDAVFDAIAGALATLGDPIEVLTNVLLYHVSPSAKPLAEVAQLETVDTLLDGATFSPDGTTLVDNEPDLKDPSLVATDVGASNGIVHVIDRVLIPLDIPGNEPQPVTVEAEDMELSGYRVEQDGDASGDALIKLSGKTGTASTTFEGQAGEYDLELFYFDEIDGRAKIEVLINGERVEKIRLDEHLGGFTATAGNATSVVIEDLHLEHGDTIEFVGRKNGLEFARIDKFVLTPAIDDEEAIAGLSASADALV